MWPSAPSWDEGREAIIAVTIPEKPGSFKAFCEAVGKRQITEFNYRYHSGREAHIFVGVQTHPENDPRSALIASLTSQGFPVLDLTENELAKLHIRHMVGGHAAKVSDEVVFRFEFPERPGALFNFLNKLGGRWNISMFHYRNHGAADGRVVAACKSRRTSAIWYRQPLKPSATRTGMKAITRLTNCPRLSDYADWGGL